MSPEDGYPPRVGDSGARPAAGCASEHLGQLAFGERVAGLSAPPVRGHRGVIDRVGLRYRLVTLPTGGDGRRPGDPCRRLPCLVWCVALAPATELGAGGFGRGRTRRSAAGRGVAEVPGPRPVFYCPGRADEPDQELVRRLRRLTAARPRLAPRRDRGTSPGPCSPVACQNLYRASDLGFYPRHSCSSVSPTCSWSGRSTGWRCSRERHIQRRGDLGTAARDRDPARPGRPPEAGLG